MQKIEAIIQPQAFDDVKDALVAVGVEAMTVSEVRGYGRQKGHSANYRGIEYKVDLLPKIKIEIVLLNERVEEVMGTLMRAARTGQMGDGKIFILDVADAIRIRKYDRGEAAL